MSIEAYQANTVKEYKAPEAVKPPEPVEQYQARTLDPPAPVAKTITPDTPPKAINAEQSQITIDHGNGTRPVPDSGLDDFLGALVGGFLEGLLDTQPAGSGDKKPDAPGNNTPPTGSGKTGAPGDGKGAPQTGDKQVVVKGGDTLGKIAAENGVTLQQLKDANPDLFKNGKDADGKNRRADGGLIYPGDKVKIPGKGDPKPADPKADGKGDPQKTDPKPTPKPDTPKPETGDKIGHKVKFSSVADPHVTTGNGRKFDNHEAGDFVLAKSKTGNLLVEAHNDKLPGDSGLWQTKGGIKTDGDVVDYDAASNSLTVNGKAVPFKPGDRIDLPGGGYVQTSNDKLPNGTPFNRVQVHTKEGDDVYMLRFIRPNGGAYLDFAGSISGNRDKNDVKGLAGALNGSGNSANDLQERDGTVTQDVNAFVNDWKVKDGENILK
jgi:hypothetical protein